jgi:hypothetical protein
VLVRFRSRFARARKKRTGPGNTFPNQLTNSYIIMLA